VILVNGALAAYLARGDRQLLSFLPDTEPEQSRVGRAVARVLIERARSGGDSPRGMLIEEIDGGPPDTHRLAPFLAEAGFASGALGLQATYRSSSRQSPVVSRQSQVNSRQSAVTSRQSKSSVSNPFSRRYFGDD